MLGRVVSYCFLLLWTVSSHALVRADSYPALNAADMTSLLTIRVSASPESKPISAVVTSHLAMTSSISPSQNKGPSTVSLPAASIITPTPTPSATVPTTKPTKPITDHPPEPKCEKVTSCSCRRADDHQLIDLSPLASTTARFTIKNLDHTFYWNPCKAFEVGGTNSECTVEKDVAICEETTGTDDIFVSLGTQKSAEFKFDRIIYTDGTGNRNATVILQCQKNDKPEDSKLIFLPDKNNMSYIFALQSVYACPGGYKPGSGGLSAGSILLIIFFTVIGFYFMVGIAYQVVFKKASGTEIIPNSAFWCALPSYIKDGITYLFCCGGSGRSAKYENF